jgi:hypothetical protein
MRGNSHFFHVALRALACEDVEPGLPGWWYVRTRSCGGAVHVDVMIRETILGVVGQRIVRSGIISAHVLRWW